MNTLFQKIPRTLLIFFIILGFNYGVSFQQFLHFDWEDLRGMSDTASYLAMYNGDYNVSSGHRYRIIIPYLANHVRHTIQSSIPSNQLEWVGGVDALSFYIVNHFITSLAGLFLFLFLVKLKFETKLSLLGVFIFLGSRITILSTGAPSVDSLYHLAIIIVVYFCLTQQTIVLSLLNPILILTKETTLPFLFFPVLIKGMSRKIILVSLALSIIIFFWVRSLITATIPGAIDTNDPIFTVIMHHLPAGLDNIRQNYFTLVGWHGIFSAFSVFWIFAAFGAWLRFRGIVTQYQIPNFLFWIVPIVFITTILSYNMARMTLSLFPLVIPYALIGMDYLISSKEKATDQS